MPKKDWQAIDGLGLKGFERVEHVAKSTYRDSSMVVICPLRTTMVHKRVVEAWQALQWPMNQKRAMFLVTGAEVGEAYDDQLAAVLAHPELGQWKYLLTLEDDNLPPPDAASKLVEAIELGPFDGVGGLYFTKGEGLNAPQCYGDPVEYARTGVLDFRPRDMVAALKQGAIVPCNGIAMGCSLYRMSMFRDIPRPWFQTNASNTQDLFFCSKAVRAGKRFAVDTRVRVGHLDVETGVVY
jgi:hypothetical protein